MSKRKQTGRNAKKRLIRQQLSYWTAEGEPKDKEAIERHLAAKKQIVAQKRELLVASYEAELRLRANRLDFAGCWEFLFTALPEARQFGCEDRLKSLVAHYATQFAAAGACTIQ